MDLQWILILLRLTYSNSLDQSNELAMNLNPNNDNDTLSDKLDQSDIERNTLNQSEFKRHWENV